MNNQDQDKEHASRAYNNKNSQDRSSDRTVRSSRDGGFAGRNDRPASQNQNRDGAGGGERRSFSDRPPRPRPEGGFASRSDRPASQNQNRDGAGGERRSFSDRPPRPRPEGGFAGRGDRPARPSQNINNEKVGFSDKKSSDTEKKKIVPNQFSQNNSYNHHSSANEYIRIHKLLAELGIGSRRSIEKSIEIGKIIVNGERAIIGQKINLDDNVSINGHKINLHAKEWIKPRIIMYHKASGEIVSHADPENRPSVFDRLPRIRNGKWIAIGRLDFNTEGLLMFTNNGELANKFMHPSYGIEREYAVRVIGSLEPETQEQLLNGILLDDGLANFSKIEDAGGENLNHWYKVTISEGRNREVRRMFEAVGLTVSRLTRIRYGSLSLSSRLQRGRYEELYPEEVKGVLEQFNIQADIL